MRTLGLLTVLLLAQAPPREAFPGQAEHREPPKGWMCKRPEMDRIGKASKAEQATWCSCERMLDPSMLGPDNSPIIHADQECAVYCWEKSNCTCPVSGDEKRRMPLEPPR